MITVSSFEGGGGGRAGRKGPEGEYEGGCSGSFEVMTSYYSNYSIV